MRRAASLLRLGHCVALPTETVYGLAANAINAAAVRRVFEIKGRPLLDPLIVHVGSLAQAREVACLNAAGWRLAAAFWPGPLTLVLPRRPWVPDLITAGMETVAVRLPALAAPRRVIARAGVPLAAPSANPFGYISPTEAAHVAASLGTRVPYILDGGPCAHGIESTIVSVADPRRPRLLRPGPIPLEALARALGREPELPGGAAGAAIEAPGMLHRHYSPRQRLRLFESAEGPGPAAPGEAIVRLRRPARGETGTHWLSESGKLTEVARALFGLLRKLDNEPRVTRIACELPAPEGLGRALRDRLERAAAR